MPTIPPGTSVTMEAADAAMLSYPPPINALVVAVERGALKAAANSLTTVVAVTDRELTWVGSIPEGLLTVTGESPDTSADDLRRILSNRVLAGRRIWDIIRPGRLRPVRVQDTVYQGDRPWVVVGELASSAVLAVPLNDLGAGIRPPYQCRVLAGHLQFQGSKDSKMELNHIWSFPSGTAAIGRVHSDAHTDIRMALLGYFPGREA